MRFVVTFVIFCCILQYVCGYVIDDDEFHKPEYILSKTHQRLLGAENDATPGPEKDPEYWRKKAQERIKQLKNIHPIVMKAKNIILFLGDGMSLSTVASARILDGQMKGKTGEENSLSFENFPFTGLSKTYCTNGQVADSACSGTAYHCGVKANLLTLGVNARVIFNNCSSGENPENHVESIAQWAQAAGKATGFVTTTTVTNASPAAGYAHVANRLWESDFNVAKDVEDPNNCQDIASQLIYNLPGKNFDVILGGGRSNFLPQTAVDETNVRGNRLDGDDLISRWKKFHPKGKYVTNREELLNVKYSKVSNLLGLFQPMHMNYHLLANKSVQPSLAEMTESAINMLRKDPDGFFLFVEGGRIDHGHHENKAGISLIETIEFSNAIQTALKLTHPYETLIVSTSDHAHPLSLSGYSSRGNNILGTNGQKDTFNIPFTTLNYALGPKQYLNKDSSRMDITNKITPSFVYPSQINSAIGHHSGDDVGIYAYGPYAHFFTGVHEQNTIPHIMAYAACIGKGETHCHPTFPFY